LRVSGLLLALPLGYCAAVIDSTRPDLRSQGTEQPPARPGLPGRAGKRGTYLPSAQVVEELGRLGPDLTTIVDDLRSRLSELDRTLGRLELSAAAIKPGVLRLLAGAAR
jgi:hypothetical protein